MGQLKDNINTFTNLEPITDEEQEVIDEVIEDLRKINPVPCTGCRYCMDCGHGVDIPKVFGIYNDYKRSENKDIAIRYYFSFLSPEEQGGIVKNAWNACKNAPNT